MYNPDTSRPLLALQAIESFPTHRGDEAYQPFLLTVRHALSPGNTAVTRPIESVMRTNKLSNDAPNARRLLRLNRNGTTFAAVMSTKRRMPPARCAVACCISNEPHAYAVCPPGNCDVDKLHRCGPGTNASRTAVRAIMGNSVLTARPLPVSFDS